MSSGEDSKCERIPRQAAISAGGNSSLHRIQTGGEETEATPDIHPGRPAEDELHGGGDRQLPGVPEIGTGFEAPIWKPYPYQARGIAWLLKPVAALFLPPGLGKTSISLAAILQLKEMGLPHRTLLLAPLMVCRTTWMTEPKKWRQFQDLKIGLAHGPDKELVLSDTYYDIVVMNYDGLPWAVPILKGGHNFAILLCDEITRVKNTSSQRFKLLKTVLTTFLFRWGLTGTPAANGLMDLFGQVYVLDLGQRLGRYITHFRLKYFHQHSWDQYRYYISPEKAEELTKQLSDLAMFVEPSEWLDLPEFMVIQYDVELSKEARPRYEFLQEEFILQLQSSVLTAANAGVLTSKLRQFTGGAVYTDAPLFERVDTAKIERLKDLVEELAGEPLLVSYQFDHERIRLLEAFPTALVLKGGMTAKQVESVVNAWNDGTTPVLLVQPASAALGLNLQFGGAAICWFTLTYNLEEFIQLNKRLHRHGQTRSVRCYLLAADKTIDQRVAKVLAQKDVVQNDVFEALKMEM